MTAPKVSSRNAVSIVVREHRGHQWTDMTGLTVLAHRSENTIRPLLTSHHDAPDSLWIDGHNTKQGNREWFRLDQARSFAEAIRQPQLVETTADPGELLAGEEAAAEWNWSWSTLRRNCQRSIPVWINTGDLTCGYVPFPDEGPDPREPGTWKRPSTWKWRRDTLTGFVRPGRGRSVGSPTVAPVAAVGLSEVFDPAHVSVDVLCSILQQHQFTNENDIAAALGAHVSAPVGRQKVRALLRAARLRALKGIIADTSNSRSVSDLSGIRSQLFREVPYQLSLKALRQLLDDVSNDLA